MKLKTYLRDALRALGLLEGARILKTGLNRTASDARAHHQRFTNFHRRYADSFGQALGDPRPNAKRVVVVSGGSIRVEMELCLMKALEAADCLSIPLARSNLIRKYYHLLPQADVRLFDDLCDSAPFYQRAESVMHRCGSIRALLDVEFAGARVGGHAVSSMRRNLMSGSLDLKSANIRARLVDCLAASMASAVGAWRIIEELRPAFVLSDDTSYTPRGEFLDVFIAAKIPVIRFFPAHDGSALILKRYSGANRYADHNSLSDASWQTVCRMSWNDERREELWQEIGACYAEGVWYGEAGTQFGRRLIDVDTVRERLQIDPSKKTAFIFPHIAWDASFGRGHDLFESYDEWLVETVRAACANKHLRWIVKVHPSHVFKGQGRHSTEAKILSDHLGRLPPHVSILPADSDISTFSLFPVMDYCLTVRGTAGLEAACLGIPVLTGGTGRYDRKGFTIDSATPAEYLERIAQLQDVPRLSPAQIELAERYAYGLFLLRPLTLSSVTTKYHQKYGAENFYNLTKVNLQTREDWQQAGDLRAFADWALNSDEEDFLLTVPTLPRSERRDQRELALTGFESLRPAARYA